MKYKVLPVLLITCVFSSFAQAKDSYIPVLYNLSTIFDFNPVKGDVKTLDSVVNNLDGKEIYRIHIELNNKGCVDLLDLNNVGGGYAVLLKRHGDVLSGTKNDGKLSFQLDKACNLVSRNDNGEVSKYTVDPNGRIKSIEFLGQKISEHFYDDNSNLARVEFYASGMIASKNDVSYIDAVKKPLDYEIVNTSNYSRGFKAKSHCNYSEKLIPIQCELSIQQSSHPEAPPTILNAHTSVEFF